MTDTDRSGLPLPDLARIAGVLYLIVAICGGFAQAVRMNVWTSGDATTTADNIRASAATFRLAFASDLVNITAFVALALVLYALLAPVARRAAAAFVIFNAISVAIMGVNLVAHAGALVAATDPAVESALGIQTANGLALLLLDVQHVGVLVAQIFFGLWLLPLGYAVYRSAWFPRALGIALALGCVGYLADVVASIASRGFTSSLTPFLAFPAGLAEIAFLLWLLVKGASLRRTAAAPKGELTWSA